MIRCLGFEEVPPRDPDLLEAWCAIGNSARPVQEHLGETGSVLWVNANGTLCVQFDDGDERVLFPCEVEFVPRG